MPVVAVAASRHVYRGSPYAAADPDEIMQLVMGIPKHKDVVLLSADPSALQATRAVRLALGEERIGLAHYDAPPTAFVFGVAGATLLPEGRLGLVPAVLAAVAAATTTTAYLSSVGSLERPVPKLTQHLVSSLPWTRFVVDWGSQTVQVAHGPRVPTGIAIMVSASERPMPDVDESGWPAARGVLAGDDGSFWGSRRWLETSVLHERLDSVVAGLASREEVARHSACRSCGRVGGPGLCAFCQLPMPTDALLETTHGGRA